MWGDLTDASLICEETALNDLTKNILLWGVIVLVMFVVFSRYMPPAGQLTTVPYSTVLDDLNNSRLQSVTLQGNEILGVRKDKRPIQGIQPGDRLFGAHRLAQQGRRDHPG